jgi:hypothetical protein
LKLAHLVFIQTKNSNIFLKTPTEKEEERKEKA